MFIDVVGKNGSSDSQFIQQPAELLCSSNILEQLLGEQQLFGLRQGFYKQVHAECRRRSPNKNAVMVKDNAMKTIRTLYISELVRPAAKLTKLWTLGNHWKLI
jgi:hypothetical protein